MTDASGDQLEVVRRIYRDSDSFDAICRYRDILARRGIEWGLLGPREGPLLWERHILNSAAVAELVPEHVSVADIGSGAGLPGIPLAILRPDLTMDLVESLLRRSTFLAQAVDDLGITSRVRVVRVRAEELTSRYDVVLSRALAPLDRLVRWCRPLLNDGGTILAIKGSAAEREIADHAGLLRRSGLIAEILGCRLDDEIPPTTVVRLRER
ncbi:MAG: 16S rRNA (guanine(527)-N(7))-methyltransferase RsmG [Microlunatus sp.]